MKKSILMMIIVVTLVSCSNQNQNNNTSSNVDVPLENIEIVGDVDENEKVKEVIGTSTSTTLSNGFINSDESNIYYWKDGTLNIGKKGAFYSSKIDGSEDKMILDAAPAYINIVGDYLYFVEQSSPSFILSGSIYKMKKDGSELELILGNESSDLVIVNDWMYFIDHSNEEKAARAKLDGSCYEVIRDSRTLNLCATLQSLYYYSANEEGSFGMYMYLIEGKEEIPMDLDGWRVTVEDEYIYYLDKENFYLYRTDHSYNNTVQITDKPMYDYFIADDGIYVHGLQDPNEKTKLQFYNESLEKSEISYENESPYGDSIAAVTSELYFIWNYIGEGWELTRIRRSDLKTVN